MKCVNAKAHVVKWGVRALGQNTYVFPADLRIIFQSNEATLEARFTTPTLKGVLSSHESVTGILSNNPMMVPPFSVFMNFHP